MRFDLQRYRRSLISGITIEVVRDLLQHQMNVAPAMCLEANTLRFAISEWPCDLYKIRMAMFTGGERMSLLVDAETGLPLSGPKPSFT
jgi:hypothetical protein